MVHFRCFYSICILWILNQLAHCHPYQLPSKLKNLSKFELLPQKELWHTFVTQCRLNELFVFIFRSRMNLKSAFFEIFFCTLFKKREVDRFYLLTLYLGQVRNMQYFALKFTLRFSEQVENKMKKTRLNIIIKIYEVKSQTIL